MPNPVLHRPDLKPGSFLRKVYAALPDQPFELLVFQDLSPSLERATAPLFSPIFAAQAPANQYFIGENWGMPKAGGLYIEFAPNLTPS